MNTVTFHIHRDPEGGYTARAEGESIFTQADDLPALRAQILDAILCHHGPDADGKCALWYDQEDNEGEAVVLVKQ